jgi:hypothetical protein
MKVSAALLRIVLTWCLVFQTACATPRAGSAEGIQPRPVEISSESGGRLRLSFEPVAPNPAHEVMELEEAQAALVILHLAFLAERPEIRIVAPSRSLSSWDDRAPGWKQQLRDQFLGRFGSALLPLPEEWEHSRLFQALRLSPRYMGAGVREAAKELFSSPLFVASVCLSVMVYFAAWLAPEPLFSKAFAATVTAALALVVGVLELTNLALALIRLYRESEAAETDEELAAASERFGKVVGGMMLRVMLLVASFGIGKAVPTVPQGGIGALWGPPLHAVESGLVMGARSTAQVMVADGSLVLSGAAVGTGACGSLSLCSAMDETGGGRLSTRYGPPHTRQNPTHNESIERELAAREAAGHTDLRKNKAQLNARGNRVFDEEAVGGPRFRKPDVSSLRPDGVRHNTNYVSNPRDLKRELDAFEALRNADPDAIHELYLLDGTLIRRYVPAGVSYP